jgi:hypothetical protein
MPGCGFRLREFASKPMYVADPVERRASHGARLTGCQQLARLASVPLGRAPVAAPLHDFGAIHKALGAIAHEIGLRGTPA